jgi:hypothetical protein
MNWSMYVDIPFASFDCFLLTITSCDTVNTPQQIDFYWLDYANYLNSTTAANAAHTIEIKGSVIMDLSSQTQYIEQI